MLERQPMGEWARYPSLPLYFFGKYVRGGGSKKKPHINRLSENIFRPKTIVQNFGRKIGSVGI